MVHQSLPLHDKTDDYSSASPSSVDSSDSTVASTVVEEKIKKKEKKKKQPEKLVESGLDEDFISLGDPADQLQSPDCASIMSNYRTLNEVSQNRTSPKRTSPLRNVNRNKTPNYSDTKKI